MRGKGLTITQSTHPRTFSKLWTEYKRNYEELKKVTQEFKNVTVK